MKNIWFTADTHFGHKNIIKHCQRPFFDVKEMDETLILRWNRQVKPEDTIYHLGDFAWRDEEYYFKRLNGYKALIVGNHEKCKAVNKLPWVFMRDLYELKGFDKPITLCHYAMRVWNRSHHGSINLFGHSHGQLPGNTQQLDVGVDCWDFYPVSWEEIKEQLATLEPYNNSLRMND